MLALDSCFEDEQPEWDLPLELVSDADHCTLGYVGMRGEHLLDRSSRQSVAGNVDDVIGPSHHEDVAVVVDVGGVGRLVVTGELREVGAEEAIICFPERR